MMKNYKKLWTCIVLTTLVSIKVIAQPLSGNYTIDNTGPVTATNFTSFTQFATLVNAQGVAGGGATVTVNGQAVYTEQVTFSNAAMTATNALTIDGNGRTLTWANGTAASPHTMLLSGADFMTVKNLAIHGTNATNAHALHLWNASHNNSFLTCTITVQNNLTAINLYPVSISGSATSYNTSGNGGNNNLWDNCIVSGGYNCFQLFGLTSSPFSEGNKVTNCQILDFYNYGVYGYYTTDLFISNNIIERMNRTNSTTAYGVYLSPSCNRSIVEKNHLRRFFNNMTTSTSQAYGIYASAASSGNEILIRNNVISDMRNNGTWYCIYIAGGSVFTDHNTISMDDQSGSFTSATTLYAIYNASSPARIANNLITITRSGPGTKYGLYYGTITTFTSNGNVVHTSNGANFGYVTAARTTYSAWVSNSPYDKSGSDENPMYNNPAAMDYVPTNTVINNIGIPVGVTDDKVNTLRSLVMPDPGAFEMFTQPCVGSPAQVSVVGPTVNVCPGMSVNLSIPVNQFLNSGISLQWQASTLAIAGFTSVPTATAPMEGFSPQQTSYFTALLTCANGNNTSIAVPFQVNVIAPTNTSVPYLESFETLAINNLPNCGWSASNYPGGFASGNTITYTTSSTNGRYPRTGTNFASFYFTPAGQHYFYTNGIQLQAGVTYSASMWFITEATSSPNFTDLSILIGPNQTSVGHKTIVSTNGPAQSVIYKQLSDTFQVSTSGIYYVAIRATSTSGGAQYLSWDDLEITVPCQLNGPRMLIGTTSQSMVCSGETIHLNATGAASYTWNTGQNGPAISAVAPVVINPISYDFYVTGVNALTNCTAMISQNFMVSPSPVVLAVANNPAICQGQSAILTALGTGGNYIWAHGVNSPVTTVTPSVNTTYMVNGSNVYGCIATGSVMVVVRQNPLVNALASYSAICSGDDLQLDATGAANYNWTSSTGGVYSGPTVIIRPTTSANYFVSGTDINGCSNTANITVAVNDCTGLLENHLGSMELFPNPVNEVLNIKFASGVVTTVKMYDMTGKEVFSNVISSNKEEVNMSGLKSGVYTLVVNSDNASKTFKIVKMD